MSDHHRQHLAKYMSGHKGDSGKKSIESTVTKLSGTTSVPRHRKASSARNRLCHSHKKVDIDSLPSEILLKIFSYFSAQSLLCAGQVCKRWYNLANDNFLWTCIFKQYVGNIEGQKSPAGDDRTPLNQATNLFWKKQCIVKLAERRNKRAFRGLNVFSEYTRLPKHLERSLKNAGVYWKLCIVDQHGDNHCFLQKDAVWHNMSVAVRWFALNFPSLAQIKKIQIFSCNPLFYDQTDGAINPGNSSSPHQLSLLNEMDIKGSSMKNLAIGGDEMVDIFILAGGVLLATWKADDHIAFICAGLNGYRLVERCLLGQSNRSYTPSPHKVTPDDIDSTYGLHDYTLIMEFRTFRQRIWFERVRHLDCVDGRFKSGYVIFIPIEQDDVACSSNIEKKLHFPWKTDAFKGIVKNVIWLDVIILDERNEIFHTVNSAVQISTEASIDNFSFEFENPSSSCMNYEDGKIKMYVKFNKAMDGCQSITYLELGISAGSINQWFGTGY